MARTETREDLPIVQHVYDLILWYVPHLNRFPKSFKFNLGDRIQETLYALLEGLVRARYAKNKLGTLEEMNSELEVLRYQIRLCKDFELVNVRRYEHASRRVNEIGMHLGGWIRQQRARHRT